MVRLASLTGTSDSDYTSARSQMPGINSSGKTNIYRMTQNDIESNEGRFSEIARTDSGNLLGLGSGLKSHGTSQIPDGQASWQRLSMQHKHDSFLFHLLFDISYIFSSSKQTRNKHKTKNSTRLHSRQPNIHYKTRPMTLKIRKSLIQTNNKILKKQIQKIQIQIQIETPTLPYTPGAR